MKVRVLVDDEARSMTRGAEIDVPNVVARVWLCAGDAEPIAQMPSERAERRPNGHPHEIR